MVKNEILLPLATGGGRWTLGGTHAGEQEKCGVLLATRRPHTVQYVVL